MRPDGSRGAVAVLVAATLVLLGVLAPASGAVQQDTTSCPPTSNSPACTGGEEPGDPQPPAEPPAEQPQDSSPIHQEPVEEPANEPVQEPGSSTGTSSGSSGSGGSSSGSTGDAPTSEDEDAAAEQQAPPPPPDLGPQRTFSSRWRPAEAAMEVEVVVDERDARGVDGGWTITVVLDGFPGGLDVTQVRPAPNTNAVLRAPDGVFERGAPQRLFTVFGQSSQQRYAGRYLARGTVDLGSREGGPATADAPVVVITLFQ
ncbi:MAG: hypothetical protein R3320_03680 [Nitriliruptorales bacterium]|nr:hypothetical protein [Nitriliruptorales bacterium]